MSKHSLSFRICDGSQNTANCQNLSSGKRGTASSLVAHELFLDSGKDDSFNLSRSQSYECKTQDLTVICLPSYIIHSHKLTKIACNDVSKEYNIQLRNSDNENLYVTCHQELLQIMSQYVYYRKLCIWIKEELQKKRMELLEAARKALLDARREQECLYIGESTPKTSHIKTKSECDDEQPVTKNKHSRRNSRKTSECKSYASSENSDKCTEKFSQDSFQDYCKKIGSRRPGCRSPSRTGKTHPNRSHSKSYNKTNTKKQKHADEKKRKNKVRRRSASSCDSKGKTEKKCVIL